RRECGVGGTGPEARPAVPLPPNRPGQAIPEGLPAAGGTGGPARCGPGTRARFSPAPAEPPPLPNGQARWLVLKEGELLPRGWCRQRRCIDGEEELAIGVVGVVARPRESLRVNRVAVDAAVRAGVVIPDVARLVTLAIGAVPLHPRPDR